VAKLPKDDRGCKKQNNLQHNNNVQSDQFVSARDCHASGCKPQPQRMVAIGRCNLVKSAAVARNNIAGNLQIEVRIILQKVLRADQRRIGCQQNQGCEQQLVRAAPEKICRFRHA
jgi:hypothetical protein